jgi:NAD(P)-dependent dehydrogenase (short-subunit alcohol dehydrogenase family)
MACPYLGAVYLVQKFAPDFAERGSGHVLNVTSVASMAGFRGAVTYGSARWAMRGLSWYLRADLAEFGVGVTLLNANEIGGTSYFDNASGKAGADSHARIPWLFQQWFVTMFNGDSAAAARSALNGVERGTFEVLYPQLLMVPTKLLLDAFPEVVYRAVQVGPNGRRKR